MSALLSLLTIFLLLSSAAHPALSFDPAKPYPYLAADTFSNIKNSPVERLVLFYFSSQLSSLAALSTLNTVARRLRGRFPAFQFQHCDGDLVANKADFASAGFTSPGEWFFTSTPVEGIMKYTGPVTVADLVDHIRHKYLSSSPSDVLEFRGEDAFYEELDRPSVPSPMFVKFYEPWCEHCKRLAPTFSAAATFLRNSTVRFMQVQCSSNDDTRAWCRKHDVASYPVLMLFDGERKPVRYEEEMRSVAAFDRWFEARVDGYVSAVNEDRKRTRSSRKGQTEKGEGKEGKKEERSVEVKEVEKGMMQKMVAAVQKNKEEAEKQPSTVEERLSALEAELHTMHGTLKAVQRAVEGLVAVKRAE